MTENIKLLRLNLCLDALWNINCFLEEADYTVTTAINNYNKTMTIVLSIHQA